MLGLLPVFLFLADWVDTRDWPTLVAVYTACIGLLMVSRLPTPSPKGWRVRRSLVIWVLLGAAVLAGFLTMRPWAVLVLSCLVYLGVLAHGSWHHRRRLT